MPARKNITGRPDHSRSRGRGRGRGHSQAWASKHAGPPEHKRRRLTKKSTADSPIGHDWELAKHDHSADNAGKADEGEDDEADAEEGESEGQQEGSESEPGGNWNPEDNSDNMDEEEVEAVKEAPVVGSQQKMVLFCSLCKLSSQDQCARQSQPRVAHNWPLTKHSRELSLLCDILS